MTDQGTSPDVLIIGAGPAGLAAAIELRRRGITSLAVLERESEPGGVPRHCAHPPFGMREFHRVLTGCQYAQRIVDCASIAGVDFWLNHTVTALNADGVIDITSPDKGSMQLKPKRVILATGTRETPRSTRLVGGDRPLGVLNTGALQGLVNLKELLPFRSPIIVGTELVSFSALLTCRHAGIRPVEMIEEATRPIARRPLQMLPMIFRVPLALRTRLTGIYGSSRVESVEVVNDDGHVRTIKCDGVLITGNFTPEASLVRCGTLEFDMRSGGPIVDQYGRCTDPSYFAAGNVLRPVETAGWSYREGASVGRWVADDLNGLLPAATNHINLNLGAQFKYVVPQRICPPFTNGFGALQLRVNSRVRGQLHVNVQNKLIRLRRISALPERRLLVPLSDLQRKDICSSFLSEETITLEIN